MAQPVRSNITVKKAKTKPKNKKKEDKRLPQVTKKSRKQYLKERKHPDYGTSKLEAKFARDFLDKLGVEYVYQFKAESIGRYYDFAIPSANILIEVDGNFFHSFGLTYEEMSPMQKKNKRVDEEKDHWAVANGIHLIRIWESDINEHPEQVMEMLKKELGIGKERQGLIENKRKRH